MHAVAVQRRPRGCRGRRPEPRHAASAPRRSRSRRCRSRSAYDDLDARELAIASASHRAESEQLAAVRMLLAARPRRRGRPRVRPRRAARRRGSSTTAPASTPGCSPSAARTAGACEGYRLPEPPDAAHDLARRRRGGARRRGRIAARGRRLRRPDVRPLARADGAPCSRGSRRARGGARVADAMRAHPELIRGHGRRTRVLMQTLPGASRRAAPRACSAACCRTARVRDQVRGRSGPRARPRRSQPFSSVSALAVPRLYELPVVEQPRRDVGAIVVE